MRIVSKLLLLLLIILISMLFACGPSPKPRPVEPTKIEQLAAKAERYEQWFLTKQDKSGFIEVAECDSLFMTGISNPKAKLEVAEVSPGRWFRRPVYYPECWSVGASRSEMSRDGLLGVMYWAVENKRPDVLIRLWDYGAANNWIMARNGGEHAIFGPPHISLLAQALFYTSDGKYDFAVRHIRYPDVSAADGFVGHLQVLQWLMQKTIYGSILGSDRYLIEQHAKNRPYNALMLFMNGEHDKATDVLLNSFPNDRLPNSTDWCADWINGQDFTGTGIYPCPEKSREHSGGDFLFVARLILAYNGYPQR
jgi:hypothetical protein